MIVYKFGGASVKDAEGVRNLTDIISNNKDEKLVIVVSAMGKITNALEKVYKSYLKCLPDKTENFEEVKKYHHQIVWELFGKKSKAVMDSLDEEFIKLKQILSTEPSFERDYEYDRIVSFGEILSSKIVFEYLKSQNIELKWVDIRSCLKTDETYREAKVDFERSLPLIEEAFNEKGINIYLTQGFIGGTLSGNSTTLGREGSDYSAALISFFLNAENVTIWKDVEGVLNADPRLMHDAVKLNEISYHEAIELAYYGAQIIHPKTIKPLENKKIPLYVKPFLSYKEQGTLIHEIKESICIPPVYIVKSNQVLISISPKDFSFIAEDNLSQIFAKLAKHRMKVNLMQNSAISFSIVTDNDESKIHYFIGELGSSFKILYNQNLELITIRHYTSDAVSRMINNKQVFLQQKSRNTVRFVVK